MNLSIIVPVYNTEKYLCRCFESILNDVSDEVKIEIIFVNDGSTDGSLQLLREFEHSHDFVKIITQHNQGLSVARNTGIQASTGDYFLLLDSDDWINFGTIQKMLPYAITNELDLVSYRLEYFDENYSSLGLRARHPVEYNKILKGTEALKKGYQPSSSCLFIYRKDFVVKNDLRFYPKITQEDVEFTIRLMLKADKVFFSQEIGYNYYRHTGTLSLPQSMEKLEKYLCDSIAVSKLIKQNKTNSNDKAILQVIEKNYNSVVWNLLWRFLTKPKETDFGFKNKCISELSRNGLYPIKGFLKTPFQYLTSWFFNFETFFKLVLRFRN